MTETLATALQAVEIFAARHPRPSHVSQKQAAEMLDKSVPTIRKMIASGKLKLNACGMIPVEMIDAALKAN